MGERGCGGQGVGWGDQPDWSPGSESCVSRQVSLGLGFPIWNVGVFDETENSAGGKVFGLLRLVSPRVGLEALIRLYRACCLPGGQSERVRLQGHSLGHPSSGPCGPCPELPAGPEAAEEPNPPLHLPQFPTSVCFIHTVYSLHRALTLSPYTMLGATP